MITQEGGLARNPVTFLPQSKLNRSALARVSPSDLPHAGFCVLRAASLKSFPQDGARMHFLLRVTPLVPTPYLFGKRCPFPVSVLHVPVIEQLLADRSALYVLT